jgi:hypothetical protein
LEVARKSWEKRAALIQNELRQNRDWIGVAEVVDFLARERGNIVPSIERAASTYDQVAESLARGEFNVRGKSQMMWFDPKVKQGRMSAKTLSDVLEISGIDIRNAQYLNYCWLPREMWKKWFEKLNLDWPLHFNPTAGRKAVWSTIKDQKRCESWLTEKMRADPDNPIPKKRVREEHFLDLSERAFERAWGNAVKKADAPMWSTGGRRKTNRRPRR